MRRGSVIGPIILIVIGAAFLLNNIRPDLSVIEMFVTYWPFLLIAWGVLRLVEIFFSAIRSSAVPQRGLSGGEWFLVILLCILGSGAFMAKRHWGHFGPPNIRIRGIEMFGEPFDYTITEQKVACGKTPRVLVENFRGNARIVGSDVSEVRVAGRKTVRAFKQAEADQANEATKVEVVNQGDLIIVRTNTDRIGGDRRISADLDITVPKGATIEGRGRFGDFDVSDLHGNVDINSDNAGVRVQNIDGNFQVDLRRSDIVRAVNVKGNVEVKGRSNTIEFENIQGEVTMAGAYSDLQFRKIPKGIRYDGEQTQFRVQSVPGEIRLARGYWNGTDLVGPITVHGHSKDVQINGFTQSLEVQVDRGDIEIKPGRLPLSKMDVRTNNGDIEFSIPPAAKFDLRAEVQKGEINNEFGQPLRNESSGRGSSLRGTVGEGPAITLNSDRGTIVVRKGGVGEIFTSAPPVPRIPPVHPAPPAVDKIPIEQN